MKKILMTIESIINYVTADDISSFIDAIGIAYEYGEGFVMVNYLTLVLFVSLVFAVAIAIAVVALVIIVKLIVKNNKVNKELKEHNNEVECAKAELIYLESKRDANIDLLSHLRDQQNILEKCIEELEIENDLLNKENN